MINHHPSTELLLSYAAGNLADGFALVVASHASMCPDCRRRIAHAESIGGALLYSMEPAKMSGGALQEALSRIATEDLHDPDADPVSRHADSEAPAPLRRFVPGAFDDLAWRTLAPGMKHIRLDLDDGEPAKARLMRFAPGVATPAHSHKGHEVTMVLKGSFSDELGRFGPGDVQEADAGVSHQPMADTGEDCICLIVTDAPLKFDNLVGKILQPIFGY
jgi:putative transcriptional regulator